MTPAPSHLLSRAAMLAAGLFLTAGCTHGPLRDPTRQGPFFTPSNVLAAPSLGGVRRVVLFPIHGGAVATNETLATFDPVFAAALQRENRFEVVTLSREECLRRFRAPEFSSAAALPHGLLETLQRELAVDAVLFVDITAFSAYRPLTLGLRGKLAVVNGSSLVWSFDNVFSADEPAVANSARRFYKESDLDRVPEADFSTGVLQSPMRFAGYAAATMFGTLPPVVAPNVPAKPASRTPKVSR